MVINNREVKNVLKEGLVHEVDFVTEDGFLVFVCQLISEANTRANTARTDDTTTCLACAYYS